jgi:hypothetical protein
MTRKSKEVKDWFNLIETQNGEILRASPVERLNSLMARRTLKKLERSRFHASDPMTVYYKRRLNCMMTKQTLVTSKKSIPNTFGCHIMDAPGIISRSKAGKTGVVKTIHFGSTTVHVENPNTTGVKRNIEAGQNALARAMGKIVKPGVVIDTAKDVPLYYADPERQDLMIRERNGKLVRGTFTDGKFKPCRR